MTKFQPVLVSDYLPVAARPLKVGDLAVFITYTGAKIGCSVKRMWAAGEISDTAQVEVQVIEDQGCYKHGAKFTLDAEIVLPAV